MNKTLLVIGQPVLDHVLDVDIIHQRGTLLKVMELDAGQIILNRNSYISTEYGPGERLVFGPFQDIEDDERELGLTKAIGRKFRRGQKIQIPPEKIHIMEWREDIKKFGTENVARLGYVARSPGGGGTNCCYVISQIFKKLPLGFSGIYSEITDQIIEDCMKTIVQEVELQPVNKHMPVNVVLEGIMNNRVILKSPQPSDLVPPRLNFDAEFIFVNTVYNTCLAVAALSSAMKASQGVVACTKSLLSEDPIPASLRPNLLDFGLQPGMESIFSYFKQVILPGASKTTYIFNEDEFEYVVKYRSTADERVYVVHEGRVLFDQLILGMKVFRRLQFPNKTNLIVTVGEFGAFWLDTTDDLHYCAVLTSAETGKVEGQKNAIGDLFAGVLTALLFASEEAHEVEIVDSHDRFIKMSGTPPILMLASAAADAGVFDGFYTVNEASVNSTVHRKEHHYRYMGNLADVSIDKVELESLDDTLRNRLPDLTKGHIRVATPLAQIVPAKYLR
jgi:hypothetical protein